MFIVHTGNRIDEPDRDPPRFPADHASEVGRRLEILFGALQPEGLVSAAAAGADLLALEAAAAAGVPTTIALPLSRDEFRRRSVEDQGGDWVVRYEAALARADAVVEHDLSDRDDWYLVGNEVILDAAAHLSGGGDVIAVAVRAGSRSASDDLVERAAARGWPAIDIDPSVDPSSRPRAVVVHPVGGAPDPACIAALVDLDLDWADMALTGAGPVEIDPAAAVVVAATAEAAAAVVVRAAIDAAGAEPRQPPAPTVTMPVSGALMDRVATLRDRLAEALGSGA
jgi:hypothetical protein